MKLYVHEFAELNDFSFSRPGCAIHEIWERNVKLHQAVCIIPPPPPQQAWWQVKFGMDNEKLAPIHGIGGH